ncbi:MAG: hypothetical protein PHW76_06685 [Alphaproteobacteria bacterium]|nr:hypothetical protein [Alphaproteobacteria bacterium]
MVSSHLIQFFEVAALGVVAGAAEETVLNKMTDGRLRKAWHEYAEEVTEHALSGYRHLKKVVLRKEFKR